MPTLSGKSIWDVLRVPSPGTRIESAGPGAGPYQADTKVSKKPVGIGGKVIPANEKPAAVGYGGGPDTALTEHVGENLPPHGNSLEMTRHAYPSLAHAGPARPTVPRFNAVYDTLRTDRAWMYSNDIAISGSITPSAGGAVTVAVAAPVNQGLFTNRVGQFPGGLQAHLMIRTFGFGASALTMTGSVLLQFQDAAGGQLTPLAIVTGTQYNSDLTNINTVMTTPTTDAGNTVLGSLIATMTNGGTPVACSWFLTFAWVYILPDPAMNGYSTETIPVLARRYQEFVK